LALRYEKLKHSPWINRFMGSYYFPLIKRIFSTRRHMNKQSFTGSIPPKKKQMNYICCIVANLNMIYSVSYYLYNKAYVIIKLIRICMRL
jgi:hypothetical protein